MKKDQEINSTKITSSNNLMSNYHCGCTIPYPHSHLVAGHNCPCEKGNSLTSTHPTEQ